VLRFVSIFLVLLIVLFGLELTHVVQAAVVLPWTALLANIAAWLASTFDPGVIAYGKVLQHASSGVGVSIEAGCNGVEACIVLVAAMAAFPASWRMRLVGMALGILAVQAVNVLRVLSLFYLVEWNREWFEFAHLYLWQALIMLDVLVVWLLWIRELSRREARDALVA